MGGSIGGMAKHEQHDPLKRLCIGSCVMCSSPEMGSFYHTHHSNGGLDAADRLTLRKIILTTYTSCIKLVMSPRNRQAINVCR